MTETNHQEKEISKSIQTFNMSLKLNELINNQSETKTKIDSQIKFCPKNH